MFEKRIDNDEKQFSAHFLGGRHDSIVWFSSSVCTSVRFSCQEVYIHIYIQRRYLRFIGLLIEMMLHLDGLMSCSCELVGEDYRTREKKQKKHRENMRGRGWVNIGARWTPT